MDILEGLTGEQAEAVCHKEGPLLIIAGAGTGKTSVITRRIAWLIADKLARPTEILAVTFTEKAASEMEERVDVLVPYGFTNCAISTFHAFGDRILRDNALELGLIPDFRVLSKPEQVIFLRENLFKLPLQRYRPLGNPVRYLQALATFISRCKDEEIAPDEYIDFVQALPEVSDEEREYKVKQKELAGSFKAYDEMMKEAGFIDYGDQIILVLKLFREHPDVLKAYQERFKYILIDEFQDTNFSQFQLIKLLVANRQNLTVVADDDQSIFKFRGASISNILNFQSSFPGHKKVVLTKNFRSTQAILDSAYRLIQYNNPDRLEYYAGVNKRLISSSPIVGKPPTFILHNSVSSEADGVANVIQQKINDGASPKDFAILTRSNSTADPFIRSLNMLGIPSYFSGSSGLYSQEDVKLLVSFLRVLNDPDDTLSLYYLTSSPIYQMESYDLARCMARSSHKNRSLWWIFNHLEEEVSDEVTSDTKNLEKKASSTPSEELLEETKKIAERIVEVSPTTKKIAERIVIEIRSYIELSGSKPGGEVLYKFVTDSGYISNLLSTESILNEKRIENITKFFEIIKRSEPLLRYNRIPEFVKHLDLLIEAGDDPSTAGIDPNEDLVHILTIHKAKGLEFKYVFLVGLVERRFPSDNRSEPLPIPSALIKDTLPSGDFHLQEERRLFYVGLTRAKNELYLTAAKDYGGKAIRKTSRFVFEALDIPKEERQKKTSLLAQLAYFSEKPQQGVPGEKEGIITLSHYQIDDYSTCPLKYRYVHILKGLIQRHHTVVYGSALHSAVSFYFMRKKEKRPVTIDEVIKVFESSWFSEGFISREHEEMRLASGKKALCRFFCEQEKSGKIPTYIEQAFKVMVTSDIKLIGRFDRVDIDVNDVVIIDFKSSELTEKEKADKRCQDNLQLAIYALCWHKMAAEIPRVELHFLESGLVGSFKPDIPFLEKTEEKIQQVAFGIRKKDFSAKPDYNNCLYCAYRSICLNSKSVF
ncbi:ATP-dependent helicase [bacterium]|nr:ATP-dependent helicase [bacterium]MBU1598651.1 ATP-dependent helicase [bacterium]